MGDKSIGEDWNRIFSSNLEASQAKPCSHAAKADDSVAKFFRSYGHFFADLDPLLPNENQLIDYQKYSNLSPTHDAEIYRDIYCKNIGFEFMHISSYEERIWLQEKIENQTYAHQTYFKSSASS